MSAVRVLVLHVQHEIERRRVPFHVNPDVHAHKHTHTHTHTPNHACRYAVGGDTIRIDPAFVDGTDCDISTDIGDSPKTTRASRTIAHLSTPTTKFTAQFPELLLPVIEEVECVASPLI